MSVKKKKRSGKRAVKMSKVEAEKSLLDMSDNNVFYSSVRTLAGLWGWNRNHVSDFLMDLEKQGVLTRTLGGVGGKTKFEMIEILDEIPATLNPENKQATGQIGIDIEQVYMGDIALSPESLAQLNAVYCDVMENDAVTDLSVEQLDMIASILERQAVPTKTDAFQEPTKLEFINARAVRSLRAFQDTLGKIVGSDTRVRAGQ